MKKRSAKLKPSESQTRNHEDNPFQGYPIYPDNEDIYENFIEDEDVNPEDISKTKEPNSNNDFRRKDLNNEFSDNDLDIPGSELDDLHEDIGTEYEENNYYSLGGDNHIDLEEDQG